MTPELAKALLTREALPLNQCPIEDCQLQANFLERQINLHRLNLEVFLKQERPDMAGFTFTALCQLTQTLAVIKSEIARRKVP